MYCSNGFRKCFNDIVTATISSCSERGLTVTDDNFTRPFCVSDVRVSTACGEKKSGGGGNKKREKNPRSDVRVESVWTRRSNEPYDREQTKKKKQNGKKDRSEALCD